MPEEKPFYSLEEVASILDVDYQLIYRLVRRGELPAMRVGRVYRIAQKDLDDFVNRSREESTSGATCASCGQRFQSRQSIRGYCFSTGKPICIDCWTRLGIRSVEGKKPSPQKPHE